MITVSITNNSPNDGFIHDPNDPTMGWKLAASSTTTISMDADLFDRMHETFTALRLKTHGSSNETSYVIDTKLADDVSNVDFLGASADVTRWIGNHVSYGGAVSNPTTPSVVGARRVDVAAGEAYVDGKFFTVAASTDETGDAEIDKDNTDVSGVDLAADEDVYMHVLLVNNAGSLETIFVRGEGVDNTGSLVAEELTTAELAAAVGAYLGASGAVYSFVPIATVLFEESGGLTQTTTSLRPVPPSYS